MFKATKEFTFDCAHMLSGHEGLCANLHGHTYKVQVTMKRPDGDVQGAYLTIDNHINPESAMVLDFKHIKRICNDLFGSFDHAFIVNSECLAYTHCDEDAIPKEYKAELEIFNTVENNDLKYVVFPGRATAEQMARYFYQQIELRCKDRGLIVDIDRVKVWETPTSFAEYYKVNR